MALATKLHAPRFWDKPSLLGTLLSPLGLIYSGIVSTRQLRTEAATVPAPVIAVGNVTLGGAGKTPVTLALADLLKTMGRHPHILSRGYGSEAPPHPVEVDTATHNPSEVGDEPLLLARAAPTWVHPSRHASALRAIGRGADCLLLDDALQHHALHKDVSFLVIDTSYGLGNGQVFPAGPLREPLEFALDRTSAIVALGPDPLRVHLPQIKPVFRALLKPSPLWDTLKGKPVIAFAGLARPEKFFTMCERAGMKLLRSYPFPDHHPYTRLELSRLIDHAAEREATLVTTEKDYVKLAPEDRARVTALPVSIMWQDEPALQQFLADRLDAAHERIATTHPSLPS